MRFSDLNCFVDLSCFKQTCFYDLRLEEVALKDVAEALNRIELMDGASARHDAFHRLQISAEQAEQNGWIATANSLLPDPLSNVSETGYMISRFERGERAAILFALSENLSLLEAITMKRSDLRGVKLSPAAAQIAITSANFVTGFVAILAVQIMESIPKTVALAGEPETDAQHAGTEEAADDRRAAAELHGAPPRLGGEPCAACAVGHTAVTSPTEEDLPRRGD